MPPSTFKEVFLSECYQKHKYHYDYFLRGLQSSIPFIKLNKPVFLPANSRNSTWTLEITFQFLNTYFCLARQILWVEAVSYACWNKEYNWSLWTKNGLGNASSLWMATDYGICRKCCTGIMQTVMQKYMTNQLHRDWHMLIFMLYTEVNERWHSFLHCEEREKSEVSHPCEIPTFPHFFPFQTSTRTKMLSAISRNRLKLIEIFTFYNN